MGQRQTKATQRPGLAEELIDDILAQNDLIFEDHITTCVKPKKLDEIAVSLHAADLERLLWQKYAANNVAKALIAYIVIRYITSDENEYTKEEKRNFTSEIIRLTALDSGYVKTVSEASGGRGTSVRQIVWHQALLRRVFDDEQQLLNTFYECIYDQIVKDITLEQLVAAPDSNVPAALLRQSFSNSKRGPAVYIVKLKPWKSRSIHHKKIHCMERIWRFAELHDADHESGRLLRLNYLRLITSHCHDGTLSIKDFSVARALSSAKSFSEWFEMVEALASGFDPAQLQKTLTESLLPKFVLFCELERPQHPEVAQTKHIAAAVDLLIRNVKENHDQDTCWVLLKALSVLQQQETKPGTASIQTSYNVLSTSILSQLAPLLEQHEPMETLVNLATAAFCQHESVKSPRHLRRTIADCAAQIPTELYDTLVARLLFQALVSKVRRHATEPTTNKPLAQEKQLLKE